MKFKILSIVLIFSMVFNVLFLVKMLSTKDSRDPRQVGYGISSTLQLVYFEFDHFDSIYNKYNDGTIDKEYMYDEAHKTANHINYLGLILESYEILPYEYFQSIYQLSNFLSKLEENPDEYNAASIERIRNVFKKNSNVTVYQIYKDYPNFLNGNIPNQLKDFFIDLNNTLK